MNNCVYKYLISVHVSERNCSHDRAMLMDLLAGWYSAVFCLPFYGVNEIHL